MHGFYKKGAMNSIFKVCFIMALAHIRCPFDKNVCTLSKAFDFVCGFFEIVLQIAMFTILAEGKCLTEDKY